MKVLIPVNRLDRAKGRLASVLSAEQRIKLAKATLLTVVDAVHDAGFEPVILSADAAVRALFVRVRTIPEDGPAPGLNPQLEWAMEVLAREADLAELMILHADLPLATPESLTSLAAVLTSKRTATLVRSPDGGTNAMVLRPPGMFALAYGKDSFRAHRAAALAAGMDTAIYLCPELELDLDTPDDLYSLLSTVEGRASAAGRLLSAWHLGDQPTRRD